MGNIDTINCYCFNYECPDSVLHKGISAVVRVPFAQVLKETSYCKVCNEGLVPKPILEVKMKVRNMLKGKTYVL